MHVNTAFLIEERGARGRGIPRGSVGQSDATALCGGRMEGCRAPVRPILPEEAHERATRERIRRGASGWSSAVNPVNLPSVPSSGHAPLHTPVLPPSDPRQQRREAARAERAAAREAESPLNRYAREMREIGGKATV